MSGIAVYTKNKSPGGNKKQSDLCCARCVWQKMTWAREQPLMLQSVEYLPVRTSPGRDQGRM